MRRVHLRGHDNILKRLLIHVGGYNLSLVLRLTIGKGTPRGLQDLATLSFAAFILLRDALCETRERLIPFRATRNTYQSQNDSARWSQANSKRDF
jgi:hypothetical protein